MSKFKRNRVMETNPQRMERKFEHHFIYIARLDKTQKRSQNIPSRSLKSVASIHLRLHSIEYLIINS